MKALVGAFNQEKALVGAFSVIVQPVVEPMDRFAALLRSQQGASSLRLLLSFAVGGLLGDVFLHLFPESYGALASSGTNTHTGYLVMGLWILGRYAVDRYIFSN